MRALRFRSTDDVPPLCRLPSCSSRIVSGRLEGRQGFRRCVGRALCHPLGGEVSTDTAEQAIVGVCGKEGQLGMTDSLVAC